MLSGYAVLSDQFWVDLCYNFGLILLIIVCVAVVLLLLCCCHVALSERWLEVEKRGRPAP